MKPDSKRHPVLQNDRLDHLVAVKSMFDAVNTISRKGGWAASQDAHSTERIHGLYLRRLGWQLWRLFSAIFQSSNKDRRVLSCVLINPGAYALTVMPCSPSSRAKVTFNIVTENELHARQTCRLSKTTHGKFWSGIWYKLMRQLNGQKISTYMLRALYHLRSINRTRPKIQNWCDKPLFPQTDEAPIQTKRFRSGLGIIHNTHQWFCLHGLASPFASQRTCMPTLVLGYWFSWYDPNFRLSLYGSKISVDLIQCFDGCLTVQYVLEDGNTLPKA